MPPSLNPKLIAKADKLLQAGDYPTALAAYRKLLKAAPKDIDLLSNAAVCAHLNNDNDTALSYLEQALKSAPDDKDLIAQRAEVLRAAAAWQPAIADYRTVLAHQPNNADAHFGLAACLEASGQPEEAATACRRACELAPSDVEAAALLAACLAKSDQLADAEAIYKQLTAAFPDNSDYATNLALTFFKQKKFHAANEMFERSRQLGALGAEQLTIWAEALVQLKRHRDALEQIENALAISADLPSARFVRGMVYQALGRFDDSETDIRFALSHNRDLIQAYDRLSQMRRLEAEDANRLQQLLDQKDQSPENIAAAGFALAKYHDRQKDYEKAFTALQKANRAKFDLNPFVPQRHSTTIDQIISGFNSAHLSRWHAGASQPGGALPVFILGMPRSGTTLTEQIIASHPQAGALGEDLYMQDLIQTLPDYPQTLPDFDSGWGRSMGEDYRRYIAEQAPGKSHITNKTPGNYFTIGLIAASLADARIIYCKRDPRDNGLSNYEQNFRSGVTFSYDLEAFAYAYAEHHRLMKHWLENAPLPILEVQYEELVSDFPAQVSRILEFLDLPPNDACFQPEKTNRPVDTASFWQVRQPVNAGSIGKWRNYEAWLGPLLNLETSD